MTDFNRDPLGGFPRKLDLKSGNVAVADVKGKRVLRINSSGEFAIALPEVLPQRFTMKFELSGPDSWYQDVLFAEDEDPYFATIDQGWMADFQVRTDFGWSRNWQVPRAKVR